MTTNNENRTGKPDEGAAVNREEQNKKTNSDQNSHDDYPRRPLNSEGSQDLPRRPYSSEGSQDRPRRPFVSEGSQDRPRRSYSDQGNSFGNYGSDRPRRSYGNEGYQDRSRLRPNFNETSEKLHSDGRPKRPRIKKSSSEDSGYFPLKDTSIPKYAPDLDPDTPIRLNKFLSNAGICSRREADEFIQAGVIKVNGEVVSELGVKIKPTDEVMFHDQPVNIERKVYVLLNKPKDCVTTSDDPQERLTVMDLVKNACRERIYPVGRLDRNTTGVLLLTNDGDLASKLSHPKFEKRKIYQATLDRDLTEEDMQKIAKGIVLDDEKIAVDELSFVSPDQKNVIGIEIHSGQNRVVRRLFEQVGYKVYKLDRVYFAGLTKKNLPRGRWRYLSDKEVSLLKMGAFV